tara:strand:+ start:474 stop:1244 length:771 start_codon:yes stop_codon:yes gene_type:complete
MKKIFLLLFLSLIINFNAEATGYIFPKNLYTDCDIINKKDPTSFQKLSFVEEKKINFWDRRKQKSSGWNKSNFKAFIFKAEFEKSKNVLIRVNSEFKTKEKAEELALKYGNMAGQLPNFLRTGLKTVTIHKGAKAWGGGNNDILIHISDREAKGKCVEEIMIHEGGHTSLDGAWGGLIKWNVWKKTIKADKKYISKYAKRFPKREDVAETINWWIAVRCKLDRISQTNYKKIIEGIPNRLKYLDEQNFDTYPLICK